jgi:hypothetical protein
MGAGKISYGSNICLRLSYRHYLEQNVCGVLDDDDWKRFDDRAVQVRELTWGEREIIQDNTFPTIFAVRLFRGGHKHGLLPNLSRLKCTLRAEQDLLQLTPFLSTPLTSLHIEASAQSFIGDRSLSNLLHSLQLLSPSIIDFGIHSTSTHESTEAPLFESILQFLDTYPHIERLTMTASAFLLIAERLPVLSTLRSLHLRTVDDNRAITPDPTPLVVLDPCSLPALTHLSGDFGNREPPFWAVLVRSVGHNLVDIRIIGGRGGSLFIIKDFEDLLVAIGNSCPVLRLLSLEYFYFPLLGDSRDLTKGLRPLFQCEQMEELLMTSAHAYDNLSFSLTDMDILDMAQAWPNIESLHLILDENADIELPEWPPSLTLCAVFILARLCPKLRHLGLTVNADSFPMHLDISRLGDFPLKMLDLGDSWINDPEGVAEWLGNVCPAGGITSWPYDEDEEGFERTEMWGRVKKLLQTAQEDRVGKQDKGLHIPSSLRSSDKENLREVVDVLRSEISAWRKNGV